MLRRRLLSIVGALGLVTGLLSSGVAARAETEPQSLDALIWTWSSSTQNVCISNGTRVDLTGGACVITQGAQAEDNVAICVQNNTSLESCVIIQENGDEDNRAIVVQRYSQSGSASEDATQRATIKQTSGSGRNDAWDLQIVTQVTSTADSLNTQTQSNRQFDTIDQTATLGGGQRVGLAQFSYQLENSNAGASQNQFSDQDVSDYAHHVNQNSTGVSTIDVGQAQVQKANGSGPKDQEVDPRCCSVQQSNTADRFNIVAFVAQDGTPQQFQRAISVGDCTTRGHCSAFQSTTQNGVNQTNTCSVSGTATATAHCTAVLDCTNSVCPTATTCTLSECATPFTICPGFAPGCVSLVLGYNNRMIALAHVAPSVSLRPSAVRSAPSAALLT